MQRKTFANNGSQWHVLHSSGFPGCNFCMGYIVGIRYKFLTWFLTWRYAIQWGIRGHHGCSQHFHGYCQLYNGLASLETPKWRNISFFMEFRTPYPRRLFYSAALLPFMSNIGLSSSILFTIRGHNSGELCMFALYAQDTHRGVSSAACAITKSVFDKRVIASAGIHL